MIKMKNSDLLKRNLNDVLLEFDKEPLSKFKIHKDKFMRGELYGLKIVVYNYDTGIPNYGIFFDYHIDMDKIEYDDFYLRVGQELIKDPYMKILLTYEGGNC